MKLIYFRNFDSGYRQHNDGPNNYFYKKTSKENNGSDNYNEVDWVTDIKFSIGNCLAEIGVSIPTVVFKYCKSNFATDKEVSNFLYAMSPAEFATKHRIPVSLEKDPPRRFYFDSSKKN